MGLTVLTADTTFYWRTDGDNANTGTSNSAAGAWRDPQFGLDWIISNIDPAGYTVELANDRPGVNETYAPPRISADNPSGLNCDRPITGARFRVGTGGNYTNLRLRGQSGGYATTIDGTVNGTIAVVIQGGCNIQLQDLTLKSSIISLIALTSGTRVLYKNIIWQGAPLSGDLYATRAAYIERNGNETIATGTATANSSNHFIATHHGIIWIGTPGVATFANNVAYGTGNHAFAYAEGLGEIIHTGNVSYVVAPYTVTGARGYAENAGFIQHSGFGSTFLPGSLPCAVDTTPAHPGFLLE